MQKWLKKNLSDFCDSKLWPTSSPDLNLDYGVRDALERKVGWVSFRSVNVLKAAVDFKWDRMREDLVQRVRIGFWR